MTIHFGKVTKYDINISPTNNKGFIVRVGCCNAVFNKVDDMLNAIKEFLENPEEVEKAYNEACSCDGPIADVPMQATAAGVGTIRNRLAEEAMDDTPGNCEARRR